MFGRRIEPVWAQKFAAPCVHIVFGARQTGKSTLLKRLLPAAAAWLDFSRPAERSDYLRHPDQFFVPFFQRHYSWSKKHWQRGVTSQKRDDLRHLVQSLDFPLHGVEVLLVS
jgi:hypothetical protein